MERATSTAQRRPTEDDRHVDRQPIQECPCPERRAQRDAISGKRVPRRYHCETFGGQARRTPDSVTSYQRIFPLQIPEVFAGVGGWRNEMSDPRHQQSLSHLSTLGVFARTSRPTKTRDLYTKRITAD